MHDSVSDFLLDLVQNSIEAKAARIELSLDEDESSLRVCLIDDGCGMSGEELERAKDPFHTDGKKHVHRRVGLGIPFLLQMVEQAGGESDIHSRKGEGTRITFSLPKDNIDLPPIGSIPEFLLPALTWPAEYEMVFRRSSSSCGSAQGYAVTRSELREVLGDFESAASLSLLRSFLISQEEEREQEEAINGKDDVGRTQKTER
jgi:hypothetical protein